MFQWKKYETGKSNPKEIKKKKKKKHKIRWKNESTNIIIETFQNVLLMNIRLWAF